MRSFISSAILATAVLGETAFGAATRHSHSHAHLHEKKSAAEKRAVAVASRLTTAGVKAASNTGTIITTDSTAGPYVVDFSNDSGKDVVVVMWSQETEEEGYDNMCVQTYPPTMAEYIPDGSVYSVSIDASKATAGKISGGFAALYPITDIASFGGINNTWGEFTFTTDTFSAVDVTRIVNMVGNSMSMSTYGSYSTTPGDAACVSDMNTCVFTCPSGNNSCVASTLDNCSGANTQNFQGTSGGCGGFSSGSGYTKVSFGA